MDYKTLYGLIFTPILLSMVFLVYTQFFPNHETIHNSQEIMQEQNFEQIDVHEFKKLLEDDEIVLIDVRSAQEQVEYGVIRDTQEHIVYGSPGFESQIAELDKTKKYLVYCWHGVRSAAVRDYMQEQGFTWVKDLQGGIDAWQKG